MEIETMSFPRLVWSVQPVGIELTRTNPLNPDVPYVTAAVARGIEINDSGRHCVFGMVEQLQSNAAGVTAEEGEIDSPPYSWVPMGNGTPIRTSVHSETSAR